MLKKLKIFDILTEYYNKEELKYLLNDDLWGINEDRALLLLLNRLDIFDQSKYLHLNPDVYSRKIDPIMHYIGNGINEERRFFFKDNRYNNFNGIHASYKIIKKNEVNKPLISVIIPVFNSEEFIEDCLNSLIFSKFKNIEILCIDDGSTDKSVSIIKKYSKADNRISIIRQHNLNAGIARNVGIINAKGEYIHFLDSDDYIHKYTYVDMLNTMKENPAPFIKFRAHCFDNKKNKIIEDWYCDVHGVKTFNRYVNIYNDMNDIIKIPDSPWSGFYSRSFLLNNNIYFDTKKCSNDVSFYYKCVEKAKKFYFSGKKVLFYRINRNNSLIDNRYKNFDDVLEKFVDIYDIFKSYDDEIQLIVLKRSIVTIFNWLQKFLENDNIEGKIKNLLHQKFKIFISKIDTRFLPSELLIKI